MKRLITVAILSFTAAVLLFAALHHTKAQGQSSRRPTTAINPAQALPLTPSGLSSPNPVINHFLDRTIFSQSWPEANITGGTPYSLEPNPIEFFCWRPCTLEMTQNVTLGNGTASGNWVLLDPYVDGSQSAVGNYGGVGEVPADGSWVVIVMDQTVSLKPGSHTTQTYIETFDAAEFWGYSNSYRIYYP